MLKRSENQLKKIDLANSLVSIYDAKPWVFAFSYKGINVVEMTKLRADIRKNNGLMMVIKNKVNTIALKRTGQFEEFAKILSGQVAIVTSSDPIAMAKILYSFDKQEKIKFLGYSNGSSLKERNELQRLALLPSAEVLRAQLLATISSPLTNLVRLLQAPSGGLVRVLDTYSKQDGVLKS